MTQRGRHGQSRYPGLYVYSLCHELVGAATRYSGCMSVIIERGTVEQSGSRVDRWATDHFLRLPSRAAARKAAKRGDLRLDGKPVESSRFVQPGDEVTLRAADSAHPPNRLVPDVVYIDDQLALVLKPPGIQTTGARYRTLERGLPNAMKVSPAPDALAAPKPVHRLDHETSGLVVVARTHSAMVSLGRAFEQRLVRKTYRALVAGRLEGRGRIDASIDGRDAVSDYVVRSHVRSLKVEWVTELDLHPVTGRTHQLRRHLQGIGHPILGDRRYALGPVLKKNGLFLAAVGVDLPHPTTGEALSCSAEPPPKFARFWAKLASRWNKFHPDPRAGEPPLAGGGGGTPGRCIESDEE